MTDNVQVRAAALTSQTQPSGLIELSIVMASLNEAETLGSCVRQAKDFPTSSGISGEIVVADNGSTDGSQDIARFLGARVVPVATRGYGAALLEGIKAAHGNCVIVGDSDDSYDFHDLYHFVHELRSGSDLVMGIRFLGGIAPGAMPFLHRYFENPILSFVGRLLFRAPTRHFHCGLSGFSRASILSLDLHTTDMEFATEMVVQAANAGLRITEMPTTLSPDGRSRPPHLRAWGDGRRHLRFLLIYSPRWLFFYPGVALMAAGMVSAAVLLPGPLFIFLVACAGFQLGLQSVVFAMLARRYATMSGLPPYSRRYNSLFNWFSLENLLLAATALLVPGIAGLIWCIVIWGQAGFGPLAYGQLVRILILSLTSISCAIQLALSGFIGGIMEVPPRAKA